MYSSFGHESASQMVLDRFCHFGMAHGSSILYAVHLSFTTLGDQTANISKTGQLLHGSSRVFCMEGAYVPLSVKMKKECLQITEM